MESLRQDYKKALLDGSNHDLILKVGDKELRAHRDILKARSRVFESMLNHDMAEKRSSIINISDCDPESMEQFLSYMYCGKVERLDHDNIFELYYISDKYEVEGLKTECQRFIQQSLSPTNVFEVIQLAVKHNDSILWENLALYVVTNMKDIFQSEKWQSLKKNNSIVANELLMKSSKQEIK